jgi:hypothetical protein
MDSLVRVSFCGQAIVVFHRLLCKDRHSGLDKFAPYSIRGNPVLSTGFPLEFTPYLIRDGNDKPHNHCKEVLDSLHYDVRSRKHRWGRFGILYL